MKKLFASTTAIMAAVLFLMSRNISAQVVLAQEDDSHIAGQLLVAEPDMPDPRFTGTVIYMVRHDQDGAMGLIVNRPMADAPLANLLKALGIEDEPASGEAVIHYGGPVEPKKFFVVHSDDYVAKSTIRASQGVGVTGSNDVMRAIARGKGPVQKILVFGYAGWAPGQLEREIKQGGWFSIPADKSVIFGGDPGAIWKRALDRRKIKT